MHKSSVVSQYHYIHLVAESTCVRFAVTLIFWYHTVKVYTVETDYNFLLGILNIISTVRTFIIWYRRFIIMLNGEQPKGRSAPIDGDALPYRYKRGTHYHMVLSHTVEI